MCATDEESVRVGSSLHFLSFNLIRSTSLLPSAGGGGGGGVSSVKRRFLQCLR